MEALDKLKTKEDNLVLYFGGLPGFKRIFSRDSLISLILMQDSEMLKDMLIFCAKTQGKKKDSTTGEELGKIIHEHPGFNLRGYFTTYNACDTTALYLIAHEIYLALTGDRHLLESQKENIEKAVAYILSHLKDGLFFEGPEFWDAEDSSLKVTYWKDSEIVKRNDGKPKYPVVYVLAHIQNLCGLRAAAKFLASEEIKKAAEIMAQSLEKLYDKDTGVFYIAVDKEGYIQGITSDSLHALFYLENEDLSETQIKNIVQASKVLESPFGYRTSGIKGSKYGKSDYSLQIWPFEQAIIHAGAKKFRLKEVEEVSSRVSEFLDSYPEFFIIDENSLVKKGNDPQLWTVAAYKYFSKV